MRIHRTLLTTLFASITLASQVSAADQAGIVKMQFVFEKAEFPQCHASTIAASKQGLVVAWFGGTREKNADVGIWVSRQVNGTWTDPVEVANGVQHRKPNDGVHRHPCWNPVLFQPDKGPLMLFYKVGPDPRRWWGMLTTSDDGGLRWSTPRRLPEGIDGPVKNKPVQLANGDILCGSSTEYDGWRVHFERTGDLGVTWERVGPVNDGKAISAIQPSFLFTGDDSLLAVGRTRQNRVFQIASDDLGMTWGAMTLGDLPNPNSGTDALTLTDGRHLIVYNHVPGDPKRWGGKRTPLNVALSDDGVNWGAALVLEDEPGEYSYPAVIQSADGQVHITYTWRRQRIKHVVVQPRKLVAKPIVEGQWPR
ncbi:MAG: sialidase family protein [Pirellulaceae bacterium]|nr:sialidase [Planctomycetaceae bacterium]HIM28956.1 sialidase [Planctomycetota bacterium]